MNVDPTSLVIAGLVASVPLVVVCLAVLFRGYSIDLHMTRVDPRLEPRARMRGQHARERLVEAQAGEFGGHRKRERRCTRGGLARVCLRRSSAIIRGTHEGCR